MGSTNGMVPVTIKATINKVISNSVYLSVYFVIIG